MAPRNLSCYRHKPFALFARYIARRPVAHGLIFFSVFAAVICSIGAQYGVKRLVDAMSLTLGAMAFLAGRTVITIAHRLYTLRNFDRILVLHAGRLMEDGAPEQLLRANGLYRRLVNQEFSRLTEIAA